MLSASSCRASVALVAAAISFACGTTQPTPVCSYTLSTSSFSFGVPGGTGTVNVTTDPKCSWTARADAAWLSIVSGATGVGNGTVSFAAGTNGGADARNGVVTIGDSSVSVRQDGTALCQYSVTPVEVTPCMSATQLTATLTAQAGCPWTASGDSSWITLTSPASGSGSATITFGVGDNWDAPRTGALLIRWPTATAGQNVRVAQAGCYYGVSKASFSFAAAGGADTFDVTQQSDPQTCGGPLQNACVWTAQSDASWIQVTTTMPRTGDNPVHFTISANATGSSRTGTIRVRDKVVQITQSAS